MNLDDEDIEVNPVDPDKEIDAYRVQLDDSYQAVYDTLTKLNATNEEVALVFNAMGLAEHIGSLKGIRATKGHEPIKATNGRRLIGQLSRAKVVHAVEPFRHLSKEKAADKIKDIVNLDAGTIRRILIKEFPGDKWRKRDESVDAS